MVWWGEGLSVAVCLMIGCGGVVWWGEGLSVTACLIGCGGVVG